MSQGTSRKFAKRMRGFAGRDANIVKYMAYRSLIKRFVTPIVAVYALDVGLTISQIAITAVVSSIVAFVLEIPSGMLADKWGHKRTLVISAMLSAVSMVLYFPAYFGQSFEWILVAIVLFFAAGALMSGTASALFFEYMKAHNKEDQYSKFHGRSRGVANAVGIVTLVISGALYAIHPFIPFVIGTIQFVIATWVIYSFDRVHALR